MTHKTEYNKGETSVWGKRKLGGYAGVKHTAKQIIDLIPDIDKYTLYVEPFAGLGRTAEYVNIPKVLNDLGELSNKYCKDKFDCIVENMDFKETISKYDSPTTIFVIDPPWRFDTYTETSYTVCDRKVIEYYQQLLDIVDNIHGNWFILSSADEHEQKNILRNSKWGLKIVESDGKVIFGKKARTMVCSNIFDSDIKDVLVTESIKTKGVAKKVDKEIHKDVCDVCGSTYTGMTYEQHESRPFHQDRL